MGEEGASGELVVGAVQDDGNANDGDDDAYNEVIKRLLGIRKEEIQHEDECVNTFLSVYIFI